MWKYKNKDLSTILTGSDICFFLKTKIEKFDSFRSWTKHVISRIESHSHPLYMISDCIPFQLWWIKRTFNSAILFEPLSTHPTLGPSLLVFKYLRWMFFQAIAVATCVREAWPVLVLTPSSLRLHWASVSAYYLQSCVNGNAVPNASVDFLSAV